mmetsp:Transcript_83209/g.101963  ORF Transcript_83209/g.101963 Transcript_83209/m.101963 type:complete len:284 (+) Transcript_83209:853-1704(+)
MQQLSGGENALLGVLAGAIEVCIDQPQLYWKNASQQGLPFTLNPRYLYRGLFASMANMATLTGIQFYGVGMVKKMITKGDNDYVLSNFEQIYSAFIGGILSGFVCGPLELTMIQQQRKGFNMYQTAYNIISQNGVYGYTRGLYSSILRESIFVAGLLGLAPVFEDEFKNRFGSSNLFVTLGASLLGALPAAILSHPMDTVKTCMQGDIERNQYNNMRQSLIKIYYDGGISRMYAGFGWRYSRMACTIFIVNRAKLYLAPYLFPKYFITDIDIDNDITTQTNLV